MMFIFAATVLSVFNIEKVTINGVVQEPKNEFSSGVLVYVLPFPPLTRDRALAFRLNFFVLFFRRPKPFQSMLKPRSAKAESLVRALDLPDY